ncbi:hypothetical protein JKF63_00750 [Porcisia hertigi]|uniref:Uncharacterized protein n=1 Tax=Porcisia hertigi TaxID=2761500 RepID=A0A836HFN4_9TRYP|nr:hypothetical protein JKF63_00750 [Porcisia hertigi]
METSPNRASASMDLYVLEYMANMRWLLRYAASELDPTVEQQYPGFIAQVAKLDLHLSGIAFERGCTLGDLPFGILRLSREAMLYLLVSDHLLGGCPPTMHPFLMRAVAADSNSAPRALPRRAPLCPDLNVSFPSDDDGDGKGRDTPRTATELDVQPLAAIDLYNEELIRQAEGRDQERGKQGMLLLLRWLFSEGVLSEYEVSLTLETGNSAAGSLCPQAMMATPAATDDEQFRRHQQLAHRLAELAPFYFGAHLLVSRSLLLQYCATLLTVEAVMQHVAYLRSVVSSSAQRFSAAPPPSSVEGAFLEWFQAIVDSINTSEAGAVVIGGLRDCAALSAFIQHGPFCDDVMDPADRDFFRLVQSGESVCVALLFYYPDAFPLVELSDALRAAEDRVRRHEDTDLSLDVLHQQLSLCYWTAIKAAARQLGIPMLLNAEEIVAYGRTALPLHLFCLTQQLFAVLATKAEEDVRVSVDTASWEQVHSKGSLAAGMKGAQFDVGTDAQGQSGTAASKESNSALSGAQQVLRRSMQEQFSAPLWATREARDGDRGTDKVRVDFGHSERLQESDTAAQLSLPGRATGSPETDECRSIQADTDVPQCEEDGTGQDTTQFSIQLAHTQRGGHLSSARACEDIPETATSVLRPMTRRRWSTLTRSSAGAAPSATSTISFDTLTKVPSAGCPDEQHNTDSRSLLFGSHVVDTYVRAEEVYAHRRHATTESDLIAQPGPERNLVRPTSSDTLLHARAVEAGLHARSTASCAGLTAVTVVTVNLPSVTVSVAEKSPLSKEKETRLSLHSPGEGNCGEKNLSAVLDLSGDSQGVVVNTARVVEPSVSSSRSSLLEFVVKIPSGPAEGAPRVATEVIPEGDLTGKKYTLTAKAASPCATVLSPRPQVLGAAARASISSRTDAINCPRVVSSMVRCSAVPIPRQLASPNHDLGERDHDAGGDMAVLERQSGGGSTGCPSPRGSLAVPKDKTALGGKSSSARHTRAPSSFAPPREPAILPPQIQTRSIFSGDNSSHPHLHRALGATDLKVKNESVSPLPVDRPTALEHATGASRSPSIPAKRTEQSVIPGTDSQKDVAEVNYVRVRSRSPASPFQKITPMRANGDALSTILKEDLEEDYTLPPCMLAASPDFQTSGLGKAPRRVGERALDPTTPLGTVSAVTDSRAVSPLTPVQTRSGSDSYDTQYATLLEDMSASELDTLRRCHRTTDEESWFSSTVHPCQRPLRSTAESVARALSPTQKPAQVCDLLDRLTGINLAELVEKDKPELYNALSQQHAIVSELKAALNGGSTRVASRGLFYTAGRRPSLPRKRYVHLHSPTEKTREFDAKAVS